MAKAMSTQNRTMVYSAEKTRPRSSSSTLSWRSVKPSTYTDPAHTPMIATKRAANSRADVDAATISGCPGDEQRPREHPRLGDVALEHGQQHDADGHAAARGRR